MRQLTSSAVIRNGFVAVIMYGYRRGDRGEGINYERVLEVGPQRAGAVAGVAAMWRNASPSDLRLKVLCPDIH